MGTFEDLYRGEFRKKYAKALLQSYLQGWGNSESQELTREQSEDFEAFLDWACQAYCNWVILKGIKGKEISVRVYGKRGLAQYPHYRHLLTFQIASTPKWKGGPGLPAEFWLPVEALVEPKPEDFEGD